MRGREVIQQLLVGGRLLKRIQLLPVQVLDESVPEHVVIGCLPNDGRDHRNASYLAGSPPPLAHDQLVAVRPYLPDNDRLKQTDGLNGLSQLGQRVLVERLPGLPRVRRDRVDRNFLEVRTRDRRTLVPVNRRTRRRRTGHPRQESRCGRPGRDQRAKSLA